MVLDLRIDKNKEEPAYFQIYEQIRNLITSGALKGESKLPSINIFIQCVRSKYYNSSYRI